jgi:hypothetical protein
MRRHRDSVQNLSCSYLTSKSLKIKIYNTLIVHTVLCEYETWSLAQMEEHRLRVFENRVPRRIFGPRRQGSNKRMEKITQ